MAKRKPEIAICPLCDERYDPNGERASIHEHPEPQSGQPRQDWFASGLPYEIWIGETPEGIAWAESKRERDRIGNRAGGGEWNRGENRRAM